ncbi:MAG: ATP-binding protein [Candidatus Hinthialibacter antarcticus]|nr:ATP-binding protein [Candidatus Hinthialibacter antarcticus]
MPKDYSPFTPGVPVDREYFIGRENEITTFIDTIRKSVHRKSFERMFVLGERGIGKSSLCKHASFVAEQQCEIMSVHVSLGGVSTLDEAVKRIFDALIKDNVDKPWFGSIKKFFGNHISQIGLFGIDFEFNISDRDLKKAVREFIPALMDLIQKIKNRKGILLILDDINGLAALPEFAHWLKSTVDQVAIKQKPFPVTLVLVGLAERRNQLIYTQPSLDRVFDLIDILPFEEAKSNDFFLNAFNTVNVKIKDDALKVLWQYSQGYPVFMHEIGDAVFKHDNDGVISSEDVYLGSVDATQVIGKKYIESNVLSAVHSPKYKSILKRFSKREIAFAFTRQESLEKLNNEESKVFDNFIRRMKKLNVICQNNELGLGTYQFTSLPYYLYFTLHRK